MRPTLKEKIKGRLRNKHPYLFGLLKRTKAKVVYVTSTDLLKLRKLDLDSSLDAFFKK